MHVVAEARRWRLTNLLLLRHRRLQRLVIGQQLRADRGASQCGAVCCGGAYVLRQCGCQASRRIAPGTDPASQRPPSQWESCAAGSARRYCSTCVVPRYAVPCTRTVHVPRCPRGELPCASQVRSVRRRPVTSCPVRTAHDTAAHGVRVNTVQCSLTSLSRDLTTSGDFEGLPASFEATASNPAAASRLTGDAAAPSARIVATPSIRTKLFRRRGC